MCSCAEILLHEKTTRLLLSCKSTVRKIQDRLLLGENFGDMPDYFSKPSPFCIAVNMVSEPSNNLVSFWENEISAK